MGSFFDSPLLTAMSGSQFILETTLSHNTDSIAVLQFSPNGNYLASGSDNGVILIYCTSSWKPMRRFIDASPVTALLWHRKARNVLLCGHGSGDLHLVDVRKSKVRLSHWPCGSFPYRIPS